MCWIAFKLLLGMAISFMYFAVNDWHWSIYLLFILALPFVLVDAESEAEAKAAEEAAAEAPQSDIEVQARGT